MAPEALRDPAPYPAFETSLTSPTPSTLSSSVVAYYTKPPGVPQHYSRHTVSALCCLMTIKKKSYLFFFFSFSCRMEYCSHQMSQVANPGPWSMEVTQRQLAQPRESRCVTSQCLPGVLLSCCLLSHGLTRAAVTLL